MATSYSTLLGLALPVQGELSGTWGDTVNNYITNYLDSAIAGTQTLSTDADVTLTKTTGSALGSSSSQYAIINCTGARTALRTITVPAASKMYTVINATTGGFAIKVVGAGPTTGVTIPNGAKAFLVWNGSDFASVAVADASAVTPVANGGTGVATLTGVAYGNGTSAFTAASAAQIVAAIGSTAVTNATNATNATNSTNATNLTGSGTVSDTATVGATGVKVGYRDVPVLNQAPATAITTADAGKVIYANAAGTITIPANASQAFPIGAVLTFINMNAGSCTIAITTDTMYWAGSGSTTSRTLAQYGMATAIKMTSTTWLISGTGLT